MQEIIIGTVLLVLLAAFAGALLSFFSQHWPKDTESLTEKINALLPQTQCGQCQYPGCRPYAEAIAQGAPINQCPPGGETTIIALSNLLGREAKPLDTAFGEHKPNLVAVIDEAACIGCTLCIQACPVDAIIGSAKQLHTVFTAACTGCELCIPPCPVDCITLKQTQ